MPDGVSLDNAPKMGRPHNELVTMKKNRHKYGVSHPKMSDPYAILIV